MIRLTGDYSELAGIQYMGVAGVSAWCIEAFRRLFKAGDQVKSPMLLTAGNDHAFLLNLGDDECPRWVAIKAGFFVKVRQFIRFAKMSRKMTLGSKGLAHTCECDCLRSRASMCAIQPQCSAVPGWC